MASSKFIQSRAEQLAQHLSELISRREVPHPLPGTRAWSRSLGVGRGTLKMALRILKRDGLLRVHPRKRVQVEHSRMHMTPSARPSVVRWLFFCRDYPNISACSQFTDPITQQLNTREIHTSVEVCNTDRLKAIHRRGPRPNELLLLEAFSHKHQTMFSDFRRSALLIGDPFEGIGLASISIDVWAAVRQAVHSLAQRGIPRFTLAIKMGTRVPVLEHLRRICREAPHPIRGELFRVPGELYEMGRAAERLAAQIRPPHGIIVITRSLGMLMTAVLRAGLRVPEQVEFVGVNTTLENVCVCPLPRHYLYPTKTFTRAVCQAAFHYFEQGELPPLRTLIPLKLTIPAAS